MFSFKKTGSYVTQGYIFIPHIILSCQIIAPTSLKMQLDSGSPLRDFGCDIVVAAKRR